MVGRGRPRPHRGRPHPRQDPGAAHGPAEAGARRQGAGHAQGARNQEPQADRGDCMARSPPTPARPRPRSLQARPVAGQAGRSRSSIRATPARAACYRGSPCVAHSSWRSSSAAAARPFTLRPNRPTRRRRPGAGRRSRRERSRQGERTRGSVACVTGARACIAAVKARDARRRSSAGVPEDQLCSAWWAVGITWCRSCATASPSSTRTTCRPSPTRTSTTRRSSPTRGKRTFAIVRSRVTIAASRVLRLVGRRLLARPVSDDGGRTWKVRPDGAGLTAALLRQGLSGLPPQPALAGERDAAGRGNRRADKRRYPRWDHRTEALATSPPASRCWAAPRPRAFGHVGTTFLAFVIFM